MTAVAVAFLLLGGDPALAQPPSPIRWEPFALEAREGTVAGAEVGRLTVPERHHTPAGATIDLAFVRLRTTHASPGAPLVYLDGGPGGPGYTVMRVPAYLRLFASIRQTRDVILLSQRGIGLSRPVPSCPSDGPLPVDVFQSVDAMIRALEPRSRGCAEAWRPKGVDLAAYNTEESADDVESLRKALGVPRLGLFGFSYGAHLALSVIRRHPGSIDRAVLAGVEGPSHTWKLPSTYNLQLDRLAKAAGVDLVGAWRAVLARADKDPFRVPVIAGGATRELLIGSAALQYFLRRDIGDTNDWPWIPAFIMQLRRGDTTLLARVAAPTYQSLSSGMRLMPLAMDCASGATATRLARIRAEEAGSVLGAMTNFPFPDVCASIKVAMLPDTFRAPITSDVPTLVISGTLDANAPPAQADEIAAGFSRATSILVENAGHESTLPLAAVQERLLAFLRGEPVSSARLTTTLPPFLPVTP